MRQQLVLLGLLLGMIALEGCSGSGSSPTLPTIAPLAPRAVAITGNSRLTAPGQTSQLSAVATMSDGSTREVTSTATWSSGNSSVATVSATGLVSAVAFGFTEILASVPGGPDPHLSGQNFTLYVLPQDTSIVEGVVYPLGGAARLADVRVELVGGPKSGQAMMTDNNGQYRFAAVSGVLQVKASKTGYVTTTQDVPQDTTRVLIQLPAIELPPDIPYASLGGAYQLTFNVSSSCRLPGDAMTRTYTAGIDQAPPGARLLVVLESGEFYNNQNHFLGNVGGTGNTVSLDLLIENSPIEDDPNPLVWGVFEKLPGNRYLQFDGTAQGTATTSGIATTLNGTVRFLTSLTANPQTCTAPDHQLLFARGAATPSRKSSYEGIR